MLKKTISMIPAVATAFLSEFSIVTMLSYYESKTQRSPSERRKVRFFPQSSHSHCALRLFECDMAVRVQRGVVHGEGLVACKGMEEGEEILR